MGFVTIFQTVPRTKLLDFLLRLPEGEATISQIATGINSNHIHVQKAIKELEKEGLIEVRSFNRIKIIRLTRNGHGRDSPKVAALRNLFDILELATA